MIAGRAKTRDGRFVPARVEIGCGKSRWVDSERVVQQKPGAEGDAIAIFYVQILCILYHTLERVCVFFSGEIEITDSQVRAFLSINTVEYSTSDAHGRSPMSLASFFFLLLFSP